MSKAVFLKDAKSGTLRLKLIGGKNYKWIKETRPQNLNPREIVKVQTNAVYLKGEENNGQGSYLEIPAASLMEYDGFTLSIYTPGVRDMDTTERANAQAADVERKRYEEENPFSESFWHMKGWYRDCSTPWIYEGSGWVKGKAARGYGLDAKIVDKSIKGELLLKYEVEKIFQ